MLSSKLTLGGLEQQVRERKASTSGKINIIYGGNIFDLKNICLKLRRKKEKQIICILIASFSLIFLRKMGLQFICKEI